MTPLTEANVVEYAQHRELIGERETPPVELLGGGVACQVLRLHATRGAIVIKQAQEQFRVAETWLVDPRRNWLEAPFQNLARQVLGAEHVLEVLDVDRDNFCFTMASAPLDARNWKTMMLAGDVRPELGAQCRWLLERLHAISPADFLRDKALFYQQRIEPYFEFTASRHPEVAGELAALSERLMRAGGAVIHGDYTPKNFLVADGQLILLDYEVGCVGWPEFDSASIINHLTLKMFHLPSRKVALYATVEKFLDGQAVHLPLLGALLLARVDGKSPVEYLRKEDKPRIRDAAKRLMNGEWRSYQGFYTSTF